MDIISISDTTESEGTEDQKSRILCHYSFNSEPETVSSQSTLRCPVSINGRTIYKIQKKAFTDTTPSSQTKVDSWFDRCTTHKTEAQDDTSIDESKQEEITPKKSLILVRLKLKEDNEKSEGENNLKTSRVPSEDYSLIYVNSKRANSMSKTSRSNNTGNTKRINRSGSSLSERITSRKNKQKRRASEFPTNGSKMEVIECSEFSPSPSCRSSSSHKNLDTETDDVPAPLSPETRKKNEFCSYLQLVNLKQTSNKDSNIIRNRRSTRVQNHMLNSARKEFQREMSEEPVRHVKKQEEKLTNRSHTKSDCDLSDSNEEDSETPAASKKSFSQLKVRLENLLENSSSVHEDSEGEEKEKQLIFGSNAHVYLSKDLIDFEKTVQKYFIEENIDFQGPKVRNVYNTVENVSISNLSRSKPVKLQNQELSKLDKENVHDNSFKRLQVNHSKNGVLKINSTSQDREDIDDPQEGSSSFIEKLNSEKINEIIFGTFLSPAIKKPFKRRKLKKKVGLIHKQLTRSTSKLRSGKIKSTTPSPLIKSKRKIRRRNVKAKKSKPIDICDEKLPVMNVEFLQTSQEANPFDEGRPVICNGMNTSTPDGRDASPSKQNENIRKLAPEHFNALVEMKKFLHPKQDLTVVTPCAVKPPIILQKIQLKSTPTALENSSRNINIHEILSFNLQNGDGGEMESAENIEANIECINENIVRTVSSEENNPRKSISVCLPKIVDVFSISESNAEKNGSSKNNNSTRYNGSHNHNGVSSSEDEAETRSQSRKTVENIERFNTNEISSVNCVVIPVAPNVEVKNLQSSLVQRKRKSINGIDSDESTPNNSEADDPLIQKIKNKKSQSFSVNISQENGSILNVSYLDYYLVITQELTVSFWNQTALGNVLGAQNMWIQLGSVQRLALDNNCEQKNSREMTVSMENSAAYVELWTKEHKSFNRERPVADIFAVVYFWRHRTNNVDKKVLQLENIKGFAEDVQYVVLRNSHSIIVSWNEIEDNERTTIIRSYNLATDYQSISNIKELATINHYISSLHNIEDCDSIVMGSGDHRFTLWNIEYGYIIATIDLTEPQPQPNTLWVKCDRGFLFTVQIVSDDVLRLIAINGISYKWKKLQVFKASTKHTKLKGICIENGLLCAFYQTGVMCWNIQSGECIFDETLPETIYVPSSKHILLVNEDEVHVRHAFSYLLTLYDS